MITYVTDLLTGPYQVAGDIVPSARLTELGLDSLALAELAAELQDTFGIRVEADEITTATTVDDLVSLLEGKGAKVPR